MDKSMDAKIIEERNGYLKFLTDGLNVTQDFPLIKEVQLDPVKYKALQDAVGQYILASLWASGVKPEFENYEDMIQKYKSELFAMPNVTPNGVIKPKIDTFVEFNLIHKRVASIVRDLKLQGKVVKMRLPLVIRMVDGVAPNWVEGRPRANNVMHSDFWTGSVCDLALLLPLLGDVANTTIKFAEPVGIRPDFLQELPSYHEGEKLYESYNQYNLGMRKGFVYYQDIYCLHGTWRRGGGLRVSMDWTLQSVNYPAIENKYSSKALANDNHFGLDEWFSVGYDKLFVDTEDFLSVRQKYEAKKLQETLFLGAAVSGQTSDTSKIIDVNRATSVLELARAVQ